MGHYDYHIQVSSDGEKWTTSATRRTRDRARAAARKLYGHTHIRVLLVTTSIIPLEKL